ncbi:Hypothetical protein Cul131001_0811 [Corynebacterium ulcerans]|nr:Hypothetical protein Cul05146_0817 [Corynebacterium ulcerans]ALD94528.1 Hypothetical protein Cul131001_0811 [Corynebacterium ulcerans]
MQVVLALQVNHVMLVPAHHKNDLFLQRSSIMEKRSLQKC